jgi:hypothetical protein
VESFPGSREKSKLAMPRHVGLRSHHDERWTLPRHRSDRVSAGLIRLRNLTQERKYVGPSSIENGGMRLLDAAPAPGT